MFLIMMMMRTIYSLFLIQKQTPRDARNKQRTEMAIEREALHQHQHHHVIFTMSVIKCVALSSRMKKASS